MPKTLKNRDVLYRGLRPSDINTDGSVNREGFLDKYPGLSLFVSGYAKPSSVLIAISRRANVKRAFGTGGNSPTPQQMYQAGYRVAEISGSDVLQAVEKANGAMTIAKKSGDEIDYRGHLDLISGQVFCDIWARKCRILTEQETFDDN